MRLLVSEDNQWITRLLVCDDSKTTFSTLSMLLLSLCMRFLVMNGRGEGDAVHKLESQLHVFY